MLRVRRRAPAASRSLLRAFTRQGVGRHEIRGGTPCLVAGETLAFFHQRACDVHGDDTAVLVTGDVNDEPVDTSLVRHALSTWQRQRVLKASSPRLWNLMWPITGQATGTFYFNNAANVLDQLLVNDNMIKPGASITADAASVTIEDEFPGHQRPRRNRSASEGSAKQSTGTGSPTTTPSRSRWKNRIDPYLYRRALL